MHQLHQKYWEKRAGEEGDDRVRKCQIEKQAKKTQNATKRGYSIGKERIA
jgi:hypothetical protein